MHPCMRIRIHDHDGLPSNYATTSSIAETRSFSSSNFKIRSSIRCIWLRSIVSSLSVSWSARAEFRVAFHDIF